MSPVIAVAVRLEASHRSSPALANATLEKHHRMAEAANVERVMHKPIVPAWPTVPMSAMGRKRTLASKVRNGWKADKSHECPQWVDSEHRERFS